MTQDLMKELYKTSIYKDSEDFASRCHIRRVTFGYSMYAKRRMSFFTRIRLIHQAYFTILRSTRLMAYIELYSQLLERRARKIRDKDVVIDKSHPQYNEIVSAVVSEKTMLDTLTSETGYKYIN